MDAFVNELFNMHCVNFSNSIILPVFLFLSQHNILLLVGVINQHKIV